MAYLDNVYAVVQIAPTGIPTYVRLSQNENGRVLNFAISGDAMPAGSTVALTGTKPDGAVYSASGTLADNVATFNEDEQLTAVAGEWDAKVEVTNSGNLIATGRIKFVIDADPSGGNIPSDSQLDGYIAEMLSLLDAGKAEAYGSPLVASTVAGMTDQSRVYVYTGSETGYTAGNWYYWNGSAWTSGGVYNAVAVSTDTTLSIAGKAADAKATGDKIDELKDDFTKLYLPENKVTEKRLYTLVSSAKPINMVDYSRITKGYYVNNGSIIASSDWNITDKIEVTPGETIYLYLMQITCFYESDGTFISQVTGVGSTTVPNDAAYLISCVINTYLPSCYITRRTGIGSAIVQDGIPSVTKKDYQAGFIPFTVPVRQTKSNNSVASTERSEGTEDYVDVDCILSLPVNYSAYGNPVKLIMMCHGAGQGVNSWKENASYQALVSIFIGRGYAVFDCNGFKNDALGWSFWGDPRGVSCWYKAYQYVVDNYNVEHEFAIYGFSMGGLTAMNLALNGFPNIKCIALGSPVLSLEACYYDIGASSVVKLLYGMGDLYDVTKTYGADPYAHIITDYDNREVTLYDGATSDLTHGYYINPTNGQPSAGNDWNITDYIPVNGDDVLSLYRMGITAFYKGDGTFISYVQNVVSATVPDGAKYMRSCIIDSNISDSCIKRTLSIIPRLPYRLPPIKIWFGSTETADAVTDTGTDLEVSGAVDKNIGIDFVNAINNAGGFAEYREVAGAGHEICYGGNAVCNQDYIEYIERYDKVYLGNLTR